MAFFDDLGKKISQAGQSAVQKTKDITDTAKLNSAISEEEKKINNAYIQLGQQYMTLYGNNPEPAFAELVNIVNTAKASIEDYKKQISDIKKVTRCVNCGAEVSNSASFCNSCGAPVPKAANNVSGDASVQCAVCGQMMTKGMKFCTSCGSKMPEAPVAPVVPETPVAPVVPETPVAPVVPETPVAPVVPETPVAPVVPETPVVPVVPETPVVPVVPETPVAPAPTVICCHNCGAKLDEETVFCTQCGTRIKY